MHLRKILYVCGLSILLIGMFVWACRDEIVVAPGTLSVALTASPVLGEAPLHGVDLTAEVTGGAQGSVTYRFDCISDGMFDVEVSMDVETFTALDVCSFDLPGTYAARVVVERGDLTANATVTINVQPSTSEPAASDSVVVEMKDNFFSPKEITVKPGTRITWSNGGVRPHTSTSDEDTWDSGTVDSGGSYSWSVPSSALSGSSFPYYCVFHGTKGGVGMAGMINVNDGTTPPPPADSVSVRMVDTFFSPKEVSVDPGTKITWTNFGLISHTSTSDDDIWDSGTVNSGEKFSWTVPAETQGGTSFPYYCIFHGDKGGVGMAGVIHVNSGNSGSAELSVALTASPASGDAPLQGVDLSAQVSGTATGSITYSFDCSNDGTVEHVFSTDLDFYTASGLCEYANVGTFTARVEAQRGGLTSESTATITADAPPPPPSGGDAVVSMKDNSFSPREVTVQPGSKITWNNVGRKDHTSTSDTGIFDSGVVSQGGSWSWTVPASTQDGASLPYYCIFHGDKGGQGMSGTIQVGIGPPPPPAAGDTVVVTTPGNTFSPERVEIEPGTTVLWEFSDGTHNVTFKDESPPGGDIPDSQPGTKASRTFPDEGDYDYECTLHDDQKGRIRVRAN